MKKPTGAAKAWGVQAWHAGFAREVGWGMRRVVPAVMFCLVLASSQAQTNYQKILSFGPLPDVGSSPRGELLAVSGGWLYGTTYGGGSNGFGTVFKFNQNGTGFASLHSFNEGCFPCGGLVQATDGTLCGTTSSGTNYLGTVFKLNQDGSGYALLHIFPAFAGDGKQPLASLTLGQGGGLYGTTFAGGSSNVGTVFALNPDGSGYRVLHHFTGASGGADGSSPSGRLCQGGDGALYGTTQAGGSNNLGTVFRMNPDGTGYSVLHHFSGAGLDGRAPYGGLVQGEDGSLYGTTYYGGADDLGTVFRLVGTNGGDYSVLMSFTGGSQGYEPFAGLVQVTDGRLYGVTRYGGASDGGTLFALSTNGNGYAVLHSFSGTGGEGSQPLAPLMLGSDGAVYGSTYWGGDYASSGVYGTLFRLFSASPPVILGESSVNGQFQLSFSGTDGQPYTLLATADVRLPLGSWTVLTNGTFAGPASFTEPATNPARFYRVRSP